MKRRVASAIVATLCRVCSATGDRGGCAMLNRTIVLGWDEAREDWRVKFPNPIYPVFGWAVFASSTPQ